MPRIREVSGLGAIDENGVERRLPQPILNTIRSMTPTNAEAYLLSRLDQFWPPPRPVDIYIHIYATDPLNMAWLVANPGVIVAPVWWVPEP